MPTITQRILSGSTNGKNIAVAATATPGTTVHTATSATGTDEHDELILYAINTDTVTRTLTIEFGGTATGDKIIQDIPPKSGMFTVIPGLRLQNSLAVAAFASAASVVNVNGTINRYTS